MLHNVERVEKLRSLARRRRRELEMKTVQPSAVEAELALGWTIERENPRSVLLSRRKDATTRLCDRVWLLLLRLGFKHLSTEKAPTLEMSDTSLFTLDVVAIDERHALAIRCFASDEPSHRAEKEIEALGSIGGRFSKVLSTQYPPHDERQVITAVFLQNVRLTERERVTALIADVLVFDENDMTYYENPPWYLAPEAAKYQLLWMAP